MFGGKYIACNIRFIRDLRVRLELTKFPVGVVNLSDGVAKIVDLLQVYSIVFKTIHHCMKMTIGVSITVPTTTLDPHGKLTKNTY